MTAPAPDPRAAATRERSLQLAEKYHGTLREVAALTGSALDGDTGTDVRNSVKSVESLTEKMDRVGRFDDPEAALLEINDLNRYTVVLPEEQYTAGMGQALTLLEERGLRAADVRNRWDDPYYRGCNVTFEDPEQTHAAIPPETAGADSPRHPVEVQFHTPASLAAKTDTHPLYRLIRSGSLTPDEERAAYALQAERNRRVRTPPGQQEPPAADPEPLRGIPPDLIDRVQRRAAELSSEGEPAGPAEDRHRLTPGRSTAAAPSDDRPEVGRAGPEPPEAGLT